MTSFDLSIVVVVHDMVREFPRTLQTLSADYQRGIDADAYEVVVVDNGSDRPIDPTLQEGFPSALSIQRVDVSSPSPASAANLGLSVARGSLVGLIIDGARMASPGLLAASRLAARLHERSIIASLGWHLGSVVHMEADEAGYDQVVEDELLDGIEWEDDGYRLFEVATLAASSGRGWFGPLGESSGLFMPQELWDEVGGLDERFCLPGGGLVNHDLYRRVCELPDVQVVVLLGEGTFHQFHGGAATSGRLTWQEMDADYRRLRGRPYHPPDPDPVLVGRVPPTAYNHVEESIRLARRRRSRLQGLR